MYVYSGANRKVHWGREQEDVRCFFLAFARHGFRFDSLRSRLIYIHFPCRCSCLGTELEFR
jgi:hypothetical protein